MLKIHQILPTIVYGDAVSNDALALMSILNKMGINSHIYSENFHPTLGKLVRNMDKLNASRNTILIYHMSTGSQLSYMIKDIAAPVKIMIYHNITPADFFRGYSRESYQLVKDGRDQLSMLKDTFDYSFADSEYNGIELRELGFKNVKELPILIPYGDYNKKPSEDVIHRLSDGNTNILFLGRIAPNKRQEDIIKSFYYYKKHIDKSSRLFLVGSYDGMELYYKALKALVKELELKDVYFTGKVSFEEILAYYRTAHVFLSMSEHEGFCVPLIESMYFGVPIIAYKEAAIPYTLNDAGVMLSSKDYLFTAGLIDRVVRDEKLRTSIIDGQNRRLADFSYDKVANLFKCYMNKIILESGLGD